MGAIGTTALKGIIKASLRTEADNDADDIIKMMKGTISMDAVAKLAAED